MRCEDSSLSPEWLSTCRAALSETDPQKLESSLHAAEWAIFNRMQDLGGNPCENPEGMAILDAIKILGRVQTEILGYPDWRSAGQVNR
jgi:hypothetical protein